MCNFFNILSVGVHEHVTVYCQLSGGVARIIDRHG